MGLPAGFKAIYHDEAILQPIELDAAMVEGAKESIMRIICLLTVAMLGCGDKSETKPAEDEERWEGQYPGECSDEADNDGDGLFDCDDSDCAGAPNCGEEEADLDADGTTDADADGGSEDDADVDVDADTDVDADADGTTGGEVDDYEGDEAGECGDGIDNDRDGIFDCTDPGCSSAPECSTTDTGATTDTDGLPPTDSDTDGDADGDVDGDVDGGEGESSCDEEEASTEAGEGEMEIRGWLTISGDVDVSSAECQITTWSWAGISPTTGLPDLDGGAAMLGSACVDCPGVLGTPVPFTVILRVAEDGEEVGVIAKVNAGGRIYEEGTDANPLMSTSTGDAEGFTFEIDVVEPGPGDPLDPPDAGADLEPPDGPDAEPDMGAPGSGG